MKEDKMNESTKLIYSTLQDIFKNVWEQQKYSELKNGVLLTFNIVILTIVVRAYFYATPIINSTLWHKIIFFALCIGFLLHIIGIIQSFFPKDSNREEMKLSSKDINIFFFGDIQKVSSNKYLEFVLEKHNLDIEDKDQALLLNLSNQIVKLSEITQYKYSSFKSSVSRLYCLTFCFTIYFSYLFFV